MRTFIILITLATLMGCSSYHADRTPIEITSNQWAMMPMVNYSQSPMAGEQLEDLLTSLLFQKGISLAQYPKQKSGKNLPTLTMTLSTPEQRQWLSKQNADYVLSGSVQEWHYKTGLDGEPAVTITLTLHNKKTQELVWSATGARSGWGRESIGYAAHTVISELLSDLPIGD